MNFNQPLPFPINEASNNRNLSFPRELESQKFMYPPYNLTAEPSYQIPKKEFNTFKLTKEEHQLTKEDIFKGAADESFISCDDISQSYIPVMGNSSKIYLRKLYSLPVCAEVKRKVEEDIIGSNKRIHQIPDDVICSLVINAHQELGMECDVVKVMNMFDIDPRKSRVLQMLQKVSTKTTLASHQENAFAMIVVKPSECIQKVFNDYLNKIECNFQNKERTIENIKRIMVKLEEMYPPLVQKSPNECASILIFLFLRGKLNTDCKRITTKKIFSNLPGIVSSKFDSCFSDLESKFNNLFVTNSDFIHQCYNV